MDVMISFTAPQLHPQEKVPCTNGTGSQLDLRVGPDSSEKRKIPCHCQKLNHSNSVVQLLVTIPSPPPPTSPTMTTTSM
jgi:hypothetical protein